MLSKRSCFDSTREEDKGDSTEDREATRREEAGTQDVGDEGLGEGGRDKTFN